VDRQIDEWVVISKGLAGGEEVIRDVPPTLASGSGIVIRGAGGKAGIAGGKGKGGKRGESAAQEGASKGTKP